ncbi:unnamed protein product [Caenorhabditis angaria]|uniref:PDZ domain-containing protein n=1 Tax=Caenorhabditis angaria TaxID=860376 RepID=A0A9P1N658_9PELO|nr:unnamed protein product [Caenorhabditis angaria]
MIQIDLYSGPPWGFRISQDQELRPIIGQIIPGGRGDIAGLKIGDLIRKIGIISVATCQQAHSLMHATRDKLTLVIES